MPVAFHDQGLVSLTGPRHPRAVSEGDLDRETDLPGRWSGSVTDRMSRLATRPPGVGLGTLYLGSQFDDLTGLPPRQVEKYLVDLENQ
jgi:hypothetical protein